MSSIERLSVAGIRSFPPDEYQTIVFGSPLTVILGQNGSGKTTLIESLKYATTGDKPPGTGQGQSFVYDPKLRNDTTARAQVRLEFTDVQNQHYQVCRSLEATQKAKKLEMKTLDNVLSRKVGDKFTSVNKKCADIDAEVVDSLGVSKAILTNVIFCHQEDSCWPLDEGKKVKEKFDAIFNADRYMKCIKLHMDIRKGLQEKLNLITRDLAHLKTRKVDAFSFRKQIATDERQLAELSENVKKYEEQMAPIKRELRTVQKILEEVNTVLLDMRSKQKDLENVRKMQQDLIQGLDEEEFGGTDLELEEKINNFKADMAERASYLEQQESKVRTLTNQLENLQKKKAELLVKVGSMRKEHEVYEQNRKQLFGDVRDVVERYGLDASFGPGDLTDAEIEECLKLLTKKAKEAKENVDQIKEEEEKKVNKQQIEIQKVRDEKTTLESQIQLKEVQCNELEAKKTTLKNRLDDLAINSGRADRIERVLKEVTDQMVKKEEELDVGSSEKDIQRLKEKLIVLADHESELDKEKSRIHEQSAARASYDLLTKQLEDKKGKATRAERANEDMLKNLLGGEIRYSDLRVQFESCLSKVSKEVKDQEKEIHKDQMEMESLKKEVEMLESQAAAKNDERKKLVEKLKDVVRADKLETELAKVQKELKTQQEAKGLNSSLKIHYEDFIRKLQTKKCCPLCHQGFPEEEQLGEIIQELKVKISKTPSYLEEIDERIKVLTKQQETLLTLRPSVEKIRDIETKDIPELKVKLEKLEKEMKVKEAALEDKLESISFAKSQEANAKNIQTEVVSLCQLIDEIAIMGSTLEKEKSKLGIGKHDASRPLHLVISEHDFAKREVKELQEKVNEMQDVISKYRKEMDEVTKKKNNLQEEKFKIAEGLREKQDVEKQLTDITKDGAELEAEVEKKKGELPTWSRRLVAAENKFVELKRHASRRNEVASHQSTNISTSDANLRALTASVRHWVESGRDQTLLQNEQSLQSVQTKEGELTVEKKNFEGRLTEARSMIDKQKMIERLLLDNRRLREKRLEESKMKREYEKLKEVYKNYKDDDVKSKEEKLESQLRKLNADLQANKGSMATLESTINQQKSTYDKQYKNVESEFKEKIFEERVHYHAVEDLNKNRVALEWAIAKFHEERMIIINRRIKELWREIYRGTDIDYVMIRTDEVDATTAGTEKRRQHSYRVVMFKGSVELDMRGRCSAGQKMLASIIIRMALAETFSGSCGVLTLDEPTTNLDRENIESLCQALTSIAERHTGQRNFQLIVITHDETFLDSISRTAYLDHYYKVKRDKSGNSQVRRVPIAHS